MTTGAAWRVGLLSDTHGRLDQRVRRALEGCRLVIHAGDVGSAAVLDALRSDGVDLVAVRGNNDVPAKWDGDRDALRRLPAAHAVSLPGGELVVVHGDRVLPARERHARLRARYPEARVVVYGHSHRLVVDRQARPWIINPGAAGRARTFGGPSCCILTADPSRWSVRRYRFPSA